MIDVLQVARGVAASLVVYSHAHGVIRKRHNELGLNDAFWSIEQGYSKIGGGVGVDLFLLLSGFIIFYTNWNKYTPRKTFLLKRITRIYPTWWVAVSGIVVLSFIPSTSADYSLTQIFASYILYPLSSPPVLEVGWVLPYIIFFYILFSIFINKETTKALWAITILLLALTIGGQYIKFDFGLWQLATNPRILTYAVGGWIAYAYKNELIKWSGIWRIVTITFIFSMSALFIHDDAYRLNNNALITRVPIASAILFLLLFDPLIKKNKMPKFAVAFGGASYSIYLFHMYPFILISGLWKRGLLVPDLHGEIIWAFLIIIGVLSGIVGYYLVERPLTRKIQLLFKPGE